MDQVLKDNPSHSRSDVVVLIDADNTLWDTNAVYVAARQCLLDEIRSALGTQVCVQVRSRDLHAIDEAIYRLHKKRYLYPPRFLARAVALVLIGEDVQSAAKKSLRGSKVESELMSESEIAKRYTRSIEFSTPHLRRGVKTGMRLLRKSSCQRIVLTEGSVRRVQRLLDHYGFSVCVNHVQSLNKSREAFDDLSRSFGDRGAQLYIIGDSLERDIAPAKAASIRTVHFPGGFRPAQRCNVVPDYTINSFLAGVKIINFRE